MHIFNSSGFNTTFVTVLCIQSTSKIHVTDVSIQLLLLFYGLVKKFSQTQKGFNTTFVTVLSKTSIQDFGMSERFNTTFVTVL